MEIGGFLPFSLCDYPGKVAAVVFTQGCNFRCPFCHNGELVFLKKETPSEYSEELILSRLQSRCHVLDGVVVTGGEPTIHHDLSLFLEKIKGIGLSVKLDTNGSCPDVLEEVIRLNLVDYIAMDIKSPWDKYDLLTGIQAPLENIQRSLNIIIKSSIPSEFRTTVIPKWLGPEDLAVIQGYIPTGISYRKQKFIPTHAFSPELRDNHHCS